MPSAAKRQCSPGCPVLVERGKCPEHTKAHERRRGTRTERGYDNRWLRASKAYLLRHPICTDSLNLHPGRPKPATQTDHIIPHKGNMQLFWDHTNWQGLCDECHSHKTASEDGGFGNSLITRTMG